MDVEDTAQESSQLNGRPGGRERRLRAQGPKADQLQAAISSLDPDLGKWADEFVFGEVWGRPGLSQDDRSLVVIVALASTGQVEQLRYYLWGALHAGVAPERIHESLIMLTVYCGFPRALSAVAAWREVAAKFAAANPSAPATPAARIPDVAD